MKRFILTEDDRAHIKDLYELEQPGPAGPPNTTAKPECKVGETGTLVQINNVFGLSNRDRGGFFCQLPITKLSTGGANSSTPQTQGAPVTPGVPPQPATVPQIQGAPVPPQPATVPQTQRAPGVPQPASGEEV